MSMEFSRQEYWSGLPFPSLGNLPNPGIELRSPALQADSLPFEPPGKPLTAEGLGSILGGGTKIPQAAWPKDKLKKKCTGPGVSWWLSGKEFTCQCKTHGFDPWAGKIPHAWGQLSPCSTTTESVLCNNRSHCNEKPVHHH